MGPMDERRLDVVRHSAVPWWAAFGAPLVGVPLMVGLLSFGSPRVELDPVIPAGEADLTSEQVEPAPAPEVEVEWVEMVAAPVAASDARC